MELEPWYPEFMCFSPLAEAREMLELNRELMKFHEHLQEHGRRYRWNHFPLYGMRQVGHESMTEEAIGITGDISSSVANEIIRKLLEAYDGREQDEQP